MDITIFTSFTTQHRILLKKNKPISYGAHAKTTFSPKKLQTLSWHNNCVHSKSFCQTQPQTTIVGNDNDDIYELQTKFSSHATRIKFEEHR